MSVARDELRQQLRALEVELRRLGLWLAQPPSAAALRSPEPFCIDTLSLDQWLQWLLIPRLNALLDGQLPLPTQCSVHGMAEESFQALDDGNRRLLTLINRIDQLVTQTP